MCQTFGCWCRGLMQGKWLKWLRGLSKINLWGSYPLEGLVRKGGAGEEGRGWWGREGLVRKGGAGEGGRGWWGREGLVREGGAGEEGRGWWGRGSAEEVGWRVKWDEVWDIVVVSPWLRGGEGGWVGCWLMDWSKDGWSGWEVK